MAQRKYSLILAALLAFTLAACTHYSADSRIRQGQDLAARAGWEERLVPAGDFQLVTFAPQYRTPVKTVYVYIEGDGLAWRDGDTPSFNPTPKNPVALKLALQQTEGAAYIARPCQYVPSEGACRDDKWWTSHRFAPEVIAAANQAIDAVKHAYGASHVVLVGYSGGGAVAALAAARRDDMAELITIAGNLDTDAWAKLHNIKPLSGSLNPADAWAALQDIPQRHFVGADDAVVPPSVAASYAARFPSAKRPAVTVIDGYDHSCCWAENRIAIWPVY